MTRIPHLHLGPRSSSQPREDSVGLSKDWEALGAVTEYQQDLLINRPGTAIKAICGVSLQIVAQFVCKTNISTDQRTSAGPGNYSGDVEIRLCNHWRFLRPICQAVLTPGSLMITADHWPLTSHHTNCSPQNSENVERESSEQLIGRSYFTAMIELQSAEEAVRLTKEILV